MNRDDLKFSLRVRHRKTEKVYTVYEVVRHSETLEELVVYYRWDEDKNEMSFWARPIDMFLDGRFEKA